MRIFLEQHIQVARPREQIGVMNCIEFAQSERATELKDLLFMQYPHGKQQM